MTFTKNQEVREIAPPHRTGIIWLIQGTGQAEKIWVRFTSAPPVVFTSGQIEPA